jgi:ribose transport system substrate-binding protein
MKSIAQHAVISLGLLIGLVSLAAAADTYEPDCFKPFSPTTKTLKFPAKKPPYRIALANGFIGNTWRIEMIKALQAYADSPEMKPFIKELRVVSTGTDVAAQIERSITLSIPAMTRS